eukprot:3290906-Rhodomonas_salina.1
MFTSGYLAGLACCSNLVRPRDEVVFDCERHAASLPPCGLQPGQPPVAPGSEERTTQAEKSCLRCGGGGVLGGRRHRGPAHAAQSLR